MDWKHRLKLHDIRDTFYFEPCNFTLNPLQDFVLTYFKPEQKRVCNYRLFRLFWGGKKGKKSPLNVFITLFNNIDGDNSVVEKNARIKRWFLKLIVALTLLFLFKICKYKILKYI